jgi:hypothetical protein
MPANEQRVAPKVYTMPEVRFHCWRKDNPDGSIEELALTDAAPRMGEADLLDALREIHDFAHDHSAGPEVPDAMWTVRDMAAAAMIATPAAPRGGEEEVFVESLRAIHNTPHPDTAPAGESRFFIEHGVVHDRKTGRHVRGVDMEGDSAENLLAILRELERDTAPAGVRELVGKVCNEIEIYADDDEHAGKMHRMAHHWRRQLMQALAALPDGREDGERLDFIERTFSGMTNRERYLPVQMIWGKGANGRTLREACDKYMAREAATRQPAQGGG